MAIVHLYKRIFYDGFPDEESRQVGLLYCADFPKNEKNRTGCTNIKTSELSIFKEAVHKAKAGGFTPKGLPSHIQSIESFPKLKSIEGVAHSVRTIISTPIRIKR